MQCGAKFSAGMGREYNATIHMSTPIQTGSKSYARQQIMDTKWGKQQVVYKRLNTERKEQREAERAENKC
eukprot:m.37101 g.37101  ORF g.37101 m.37101 type:complete len:70 (-) comp10067_c0_seq2:157-366(-)